MSNGKGIEFLVASAVLEMVRVCAPSDFEKPIDGGRTIVMLAHIPPILKERVDDAIAKKIVTDEDKVYQEMGELIVQKGLYHLACEEPTVQKAVMAHLMKKQLLDMLKHKDEEDE